MLQLAAKADETINAAVPNAAKDLNDNFEDIFICTDSWKSQKHAALGAAAGKARQFIKCGFVAYTRNRLRLIIRMCVSLCVEAISIIAKQDCEDNVKFATPRN
ncbi:MAG: hypothetical protein JF619_06155 [Massilia sp.]|nr:hypothetical protein [Massilia sp.]